MMAGKPKKVPSYCKHKASGQAVVHIDGRDFYLGVYGTPASHEKYHRVISENFESNKSSKVFELAARTRNSDLTIVELIAAYWEHAEVYYQKNGKPTSEQTSLKLAFRPLKELYGTSLVSQFGPLALEVVREKMIDAGITRKRINQHIGRIRRMFKWGVSKELLSVAIYEALMTLEGLKKGRSKAKESKPIKPVEWSVVEKTLPFLSIQIQIMIRIQLLVGCRPEEITLIRPCDIFDQNQEVWEYIPESHKAEHHDRERKIFIGFRAQALLSKWLNRDPQTYCFCPKESRKSFDIQRKSKRKTPHTPSSQARRRKRTPKKQPGNHYTTASYGQAIRNACIKAGIDHWSPNQLRHTRGTMLRKEYGLEGSQVVLGHAKADVTQIYAERNFALARTIMSETG